MALSVREHKEALGVRDGRLLIDGEWVDASDGGTWTHVHPATGEEVGRFAVATPEDVDRAVRAARRAFEEGPWPRMGSRDRARLLRRIADLIDSHGDELDRIQTLDNGLPVRFTRDIYEVSSAIARDIFDHHAGWADKLAGETLPPYREGGPQVLVVREPVGVVAAILPWNAPLMLFAQKVAPALAAGCTLVVKPSEYASFVVIRLAELLEEAGVPAGVVNLVLGPGPGPGEALITHPGVDRISFTGSRAVGQHVVAASAQNLARVTLELGGKSPQIIFDDVDSVDAAAALAIGNVSLGLSGQGCICLTRALVQESIYDEVVDKAVAFRSLAVPGDPFAETTTAGPLINRKQLDRVLGFIARGQEEGARLVAGGQRLGGELAAGYFVEPTVFADVDNRMTIAQEEIFGPVLAVVPFRDEEEAIRLANDTTYGLGAAVMTGSVARAMRVARAVRAGTVGINHHATVLPNAPFGGFKRSGLGREGGIHGIEEFTELKTILLP